MVNKSNVIKLLESLMIICMQKINFITHFIHEILQRYCILVILSTLGMPGNGHQTQWYQLVGKFNVCLHVKNQLHPSLNSRDIARIWQTFYFSYFEHVWLCSPKKSSINFRKLSCLSTREKNLIPHFFLEIFTF